MSTKQPPRVQFDFVVDEEPQVDPVYGDDDGPSIDMSVEESHDSELDLPSIEKEEIVENTIFDIPKESVKTVQNEMPEVAPPPAMRHTVGKRKGINKNGKPRKPMSEEHKKKLALAREKARVAKQVKMKERQENRELEKQEKELLKKQKVNRVQKLKEEVERDVPSEGSPPPQRPAPRPAPPQQKSLTRDDIQQAQMDAIMAYENVRKARKEEKKKAQLIEAQKMEMRRKIAQAQPQSYSYGAKDTNGRLVNRYDNCY
jgi:hypothetical protein